MELFANLKANLEPLYLPRHYQAKAEESVFTHWQGGARAVLVQMATGLGKSSVGAFIARRFLQHNMNRVLVLVDREELVRQWCDAFADICPNEYVDIEQGNRRASTDRSSLTNKWGRRRSPTRIVVASKDTLWRDHRLKRFERDEFGLIVIDECFPAGTKVSGTPIERLKVGDLVDSFNHETGKVEKRPVLAVMKNSPKQMVRVHFSDGRSVVCTAGHPFFVESLNEYTPAKLLQRGDLLKGEHSYGKISGCLSDLWRHVYSEVFNLHDMFREMFGCKKKESCTWSEGNQVRYLRKSRNHESASAKMEVLLFRGMQSNSREKRQQEQIEIRKELGKELPNELAWKEIFARDAGQDFVGVERNWVETNKTWREWQGNDNASRKISVGTRMDSRCSFRMDAGIGNTNEDGKKFWIPNVLQGGCWGFGFEDSYRNRREFPLWCGSTREGFEENGISKDIRVDRVEVLEQGSEGGFREVCSDGFVYNIEVEGNNNYFANGILVHNCSAWTSENKTWHNIVSYFNESLVVGLDATPRRGDKKPLEFDSVACEYPIWDAVNDGWLVEPVQQYVVTDGFDMSQLKDPGLGKDWSEKQIDQTWRQEKPMQGLAKQIVDWATTEGAKRRSGHILSTLVFNTSVEMARDLADILNRRHARDGSGRAAYVAAAELDTDERRRIFDEFEEGQIKYLCNFAVTCRGFDNPNIEMVVLARKTKNHALMQQMIGRGLRPMKATSFKLNAAANAAERKAILAASNKPCCILLDPVGETGMHSLEVDMVDIIGFGDYDQAVIREAKNRAISGDGRMTMEQLEETKAQVLAAEREYRGRQSYDRKDFIIDSEHSSRRIDSGINDEGGTKTKKEQPKYPTAGQIQILRQGKINENEIARLTFGEAGKLVADIKRRWKAGLCSVSQYRAMLKCGVPKEKADVMTRAEASELMDILSRNNWKLPELWGS